MSLTKVPLRPSEVEAFVQRAFGSAVRVVASREAQGGMYNAGYHLRLAGGGPSRVFLKVAPPDDISCLTHERGLMRAELDTLRRLTLAGVGAAPAVLAADLDRAVVDRDAVFLQHFPGVPLAGIPEALAEERAASLRGRIGALAAQFRTVTAPAYGYPHQKALQAPSWPQAFARMLDTAFDDALRFEISPALESLRPGLLAAAAALPHPDAPRLVHYDLWDGNVLVRRAGAGWAITGVIDWERAFYGDPLAEVVSLAFHAGGEPHPALLTALKVRLDAEARRRLALYRAYLWLVMIVEATPRGFTRTRPASWMAAVRRRLERDVAEAQ